LDTATTAKKISLYLPRIGLSCLILCLISGLVLVFYYRPLGNVFRNVEEITTLVPYGYFFRQIHYASGQLFVILMLVHTMDQFLRRRYHSYFTVEWTFLIFSLCICFFVLFTGFILKGDKEGFFAGQILMNILKEIPTIGAYTSRLFIVPGKSFFFLPFLYHCFFLPVLIIFLIRTHSHEWLPDKKFLFITSIGLFLYAIFVEHHIDIPPDAHIDIVKGPWFFLGIQNLLKIMPPLWPSLYFPGLFMGCLFILPHTRTTWRKVLHYFIIISFSFYGVLTLKVIFIGL